MGGIHWIFRAHMALLVLPREPLVTQRGAKMAEKIVNVAGVAIEYVRVSTEEQAAEGVSLDAQRAKIVA